MKLPDDVGRLLLRRYQNQHREWLSAAYGEPSWPMSITLGVPTEQAALRQVEGVRAWMHAWQRWQGVGTLCWCERCWKLLGVQRLPDKLALQNPQKLAQWAGESARWGRARHRYQALTARWPMAPHLNFYQRCGLKTPPLLNRFAILDRARTYLPGLQSMLMDQETLLSYKALWEQHPASELPFLTKDEQKVYQGLKQRRWEPGRNIRLEQERIAWDAAWNALRHSIFQGN